MKEFWAEKKVLVTGASGFLGYWLTKKLVEMGSHVVTLIRDYDPQCSLIASDLVKNVHVVNGSLEDFSSVRRAINEHEIDSVFHLGAQTIVGTALRDPLSTFESNIRGSYNLLEACRLQKGLVERVIVASSDKAYGSSLILPYTEEMALQGLHPYDVSKSCTDLLAATYYNTYNVPIAVARCGNLFGGGDLNWSRIVPGTIKNILANLPIIVRSNGLFTRDYLYVEDAVAAYLNLGMQIDKEHIVGQAFNFGPNQPYPVLEIIEGIKKVLAMPDAQVIIKNEAREEIRDQSLDSSKARKLLQWHPLYSLEQGLEETVIWYKNHLENKLKHFFLEANK